MDILISKYQVKKGALQSKQEDQTPKVLATHMDIR